MVGEPHPDAGLPQRTGITRRRLLARALGGAGILAGGAGALHELVDHGVLPGKGILDAIDGACDAAIVAEQFSTPGPSFTHSFMSRARNRRVSYTLAYPPGHGPGSHLPLSLYLHAHGGNHASSFGGTSLARSLAGHTAGGGIRPMAMIAADGGPDLYWNPHPGDNPQAMPGVLALKAQLPTSAEVVLATGCHDPRFFASQRHVSLAFVADRLS